MKLNIEKVNNGYIVTIPAKYEDEETQKYVFNSQADDSEKAEVESFADLLSFIDDILGPSTSRYSESRVYIEIKPGDKADD